MNANNPPDAQQIFGQPEGPQGEKDGGKECSSAALTALFFGRKKMDLFSEIHFLMLGAGNETRTRDPDLGKVVLYQLSYSRVLVMRIL